MPVLACMTHLRELNLYRSRVTNSGIARLAALRELSAVDLRYSRVTPGGVDTLRAAIPACEIEFVGTAPARIDAKAARPTGTGDKALAEWISTLGGKSRLHGRKTARSIARHLAHRRCPIGLARFCSCDREIESRSHRSRRSRTRSPGEISKPPRAQPQQHHGLRRRTGEPCRVTRICACCGSAAPR